MLEYKVIAFIFLKRHFNFVGYPLIRMFNIISPVKVTKCI